MRYEEIAVSDLREHPENNKWFTDIKDTSETFWREFKDNIENMGIIEPLIVNEETMEVISGNQRLKACRELGIEKVDCVLIADEDTETEVRKMITSNVMRRDIDPIMLFDYIGILRKGYNGKSRKKDEVENRPEVSIRDIANETRQDRALVSAGVKFNALSPEDKEEIRRWYAEQEKPPTNKDLIERVKDAEQISKEMKEKITALDQSVKNRDEAIKEIKADLRATKETLKEEKKKDAQQRAIVRLEDKFDAIRKDAESIATDIAGFMRQMEKLEITELHGIDAAITDSKLQQVVREIERLYGYFNKNLLEGNNGNS